MNSLNEKKTASLGRCRFTIGKTGIQPTLQIQWHLQLPSGYNYQKGGLFNSLNMAYLRKKSMSCDFRLSSVEKKTLQKRRAITIFDQFRLLGNGLWIQLKMTARRANWRLFKPLKRFLPRFHVMICICMVKTAVDNRTIVARVLSFELAWKSAPSQPLKHTNAQKAASVQDTQQ